MTPLRALRLAARLGGLAAMCGAFAIFAFLGIGPRLLGYQTLTVLTGSMAPGTPAGSLAVVVPVEPRNVAVGDVITYHVPLGDLRVVTHRVVEITEPGPNPTVRTKGDANEAADPWLTHLEGDAAWKLRASLPFVGTAINHLRQPWVRTVTVFVVPAVLAILWLVQIWSAAPTAAEAPAPRPQSRGGTVRVPGFVL